MLFLRILHWLNQVPAKVNRTFVPEEEDDSHTNLQFDVISSGIYGRWIDTPTVALKVSARKILQQATSWYIKSGD